MIHIFDGAMGTMFQQLGLLQPGVCPEMLCVDHPEQVTKVHQRYVDAGSTIIESFTFGASALKLEHYGLSDRVVEINQAAVKAAKAVKVPEGGCVKSLVAWGLPEDLLSLWEIWILRRPMIITISRLRLWHQQVQIIS